MFQTAPAVRVGLGEAFGGTQYICTGENGRSPACTGADYVFDTDFGADMTIMEEAMELLHRLQSEEIPIPHLPAAAPAWVEFLETFYPDLISPSVFDQESYQHHELSDEDMVCKNNNSTPETSSL